MFNAERYIGLIEGILPRQIPFIPEAEQDKQIQVERAALLPPAIEGHGNLTSAERVERLIQIAGAERAGNAVVVDRLGHCRPAYRGLLVYAWAQALQICRSKLSAAEMVRWENGLSEWCIDLAARVASRGELAQERSAAQGGAAAEAAWSALALQAYGSLAGRSDFRSLAAKTFTSLIGGHRPSGAFLALTPSDNLESYWHHELVVLHAVASYAVHAGDDAAAAAAARAAEFHQRETQPDHAGNQPWGLLAFILNEATRPYADELLHAAGMQPTGLTAVLLGDVLWCLRQTMRTPS